jgi:tryptophanyl-tRNA synthetase
VPSSRILSLKDPTSKMSKSAHDVRSRILLTDSAAEISAKIRAAVTDSSTAGITYDPVHRPGTSNLLTILAACTGEDVVEIATRFEGKGHGDLKVEVADAVEELIKGPRKVFEEIRSERSYLHRVAEDGARRARERAAITLTEVRRKIGLS